MADQHTVTILRRSHDGWCKARCEHPDCFWGHVCAPEDEAELRADAARHAAGGDTWEVVDRIEAPATDTHGPRA